MRTAANQRLRAALKAGKAATPARQRITGYQTLLVAQAKAHGLPVPIFEHRFAPPRRFRFDAAWLDAKVALEVNGGIWMRKARHTSGSGYARDMSKLNLAQSLGWQVYQVEPIGVKDGTAIKWIVYALSKGQVVP